MRAQHEKFMNIALQEAETALMAGEFPVGCIMVANNKVVARGRRSNSRSGKANEMDHAEMTALRDLFTNHPELNRRTVTVYSTMEPCLMCFAALLLNNITRVVFAYEDAMGGGTNLDLNRLTPLYRDIRVEIIPDVMREESLRLFKNFFTNQANDYWRDSLLSEYTLSQD
ncbi:MAG: nucleoside deaminase [Proteobacteria bacterium]|nr:nucleoside deaminase [Pseudomonadota bacterium]MBU1716247.1 nucleoside deaminase [Pseudomonadota bacterium]